MKQNGNQYTKKIYFKPQSPMYGWRENASVY